MDFSVLYGKKKILNDETAFLSIGIGPGLIKGHRHGKLTDCCSHERIPFQTLGLSFEAQAFITSRYVGFGTYLFANVNNEWNVYGFLFCLQFGKLK